MTTRGWSFLVGVAICASSTVAAAADTPPPARWFVEPRAFVGGVVPLGDARQLFDAAADLGLGVAVGRPDGRTRLRLLVALQPAFGVGGDASITLLRTSLGLELLWRRHLVTAFDLGGVVRRISVGDEISHDALGGFGAAELGWRFTPGGRWSLTASARYSAGIFLEDLFAWQELGARLTVGRAASAQQAR